MNVMKRTAFMLLSITFLSRVVGFVREIVLSYFFGTSSVSDIYMVSLIIPNVIFGLISAGIVTAYIPMQTEVLKDFDKKAGEEFTSNFTNIVLAITTILLVFGLVFTESIVKLFAIGFSGRILNTTIEFTRISLFGMYFSALTSIFGGYLQVENNFIVPAFIGLPLSVIIVISIFLASHGSIVFLAYGTLVATASQFLFMVPSIKKEGYRYSFYLDFRDVRAINTMKIALPVIVGTSVNQINTLIDTTIASSLVTGGISALNYANRLNLLVQGLFVLSVVTAMYPVMSSYASKQDYYSTRKLLTESIILVELFLIPISIGTLIFHKEVVILLYGHGAFDTTAVELTSTALFFYAFGMLGFGLRQVLSRGFYAMQQTKTPVVNGAIGMGINIVLNIILSSYLGVGGLALATSISATITTFLLLISYQKINGSLDIEQIGITSLKILLASLLMGFIAKVSYIYLDAYMMSFFSFFLSVSIGVVSYFVIIYFMRIKDVDSIAMIIKRKLGQRG